MRSYGIELYAQELARDRLRDAEQERLLRNAERERRDAEAVAGVRIVGPTLRRFSRTRVLRRFTDLLWAW
jgi:hypothetical protein